MRVITKPMVSDSYQTKTLEKLFEGIELKSHNAVTYNRLTEELTIITTDAKGSTEDIIIDTSKYSIEILNDIFEKDFLKEECRKEIIEQYIDEIAQTHGLNL